MKEDIVAALRAGIAIGQEVDGVGLVREKLESVHDGDQPLVLIDVRQKVAGEVGLAGRGAATDQDIEPCFDQGP